MYLYEFVMLRYSIRRKPISLEICVKHYLKISFSLENTNLLQICYFTSYREKQQNI